MAGSLSLIDRDAFIVSISDIGASIAVSDQAAKPYLTLSNLGPTFTLKDMP